MDSHLDKNKKSTSRMTNRVQEQKNLQSYEIGLDWNSILFQLNIFWRKKIRGNYLFLSSTTMPCHFFLLIINCDIQLMNYYFVLKTLISSVKDINSDGLLVTLPPWTTIHSHFVPINYNALSFWPSELTSLFDEMRILGTKW